MCEREIALKENDIVSHYSTEPSSVSEDCSRFMMELPHYTYTYAFCMGVEMVDKMVEI